MKRLWLIGFTLFSLGGILLVLPVLAHDDDPDAPPTYWHDVKPILETHCTVCHTEGEIGGFSLGTYEEAVEAAPVIAEQVMQGYMPPWPPGGNTPALKHDRSLSPDEIATLVQWAFTGEEGDPADYDRDEVNAQRSGQEDLRADLVLEMPVEYTPNEDMSDDYRCFLINPALNEDIFITGYTIVPGAPSVVHHVLLYVAPESALGQIERLEAEDERDGWQCFGGPRVNAGRERINGLSMSASIAGSLGAWAPGAGVQLFPPHTGDKLEAGDLIIMQVHYNLSEGTAPDRTAALLQTAPDDGTLMELGNMGLVAPVEIPCPAGVDSPDCTREAAFSLAVGDTAINTRLQNEGLLAICRASVGDYADQDSVPVTSTCTQRVRVDGFAVSVAGHMHELGKQIVITLNEDAPDEQILLDIPEWDFHWQSGYAFVEPIPVEVGDEMTITCTWDNSESERYIVWGEGTSDEMCLGGVTILRLPDGMTHAEFQAAFPEIFAGEDRP